MGKYKSSYAAHEIIKRSMKKYINHNGRGVMSGHPGVGVGWGWGCVHVPVPSA